MRGEAAKSIGCNLAHSAEKLLYDPVNQADYTSGICTLSGLSWCTGNSFSSTASRHARKPVLYLLLYISLQELSTLNALEVLMNSCTQGAYFALLTCY